MKNPDPAQGSESASPVGKTRTWWHPLLVQLLEHELGTAYQVFDELPVGRMPLRVDILLVQRQSGEPSPTARRDLAALLPLLNRFTLIEFKGPTDQLERGDLAQLIGCAFLWHGQQEVLVGCRDVSLVVVAPRQTSPFLEEIAALGGRAVEDEPGILRVEAVPFRAWLVETDIMAERGEAVLSLVSRVFLRDRERIMKALERTGRGRLLHFVFQQIQHFRRLGKEFAMQHTQTDYLGELEEDLKAEFLAELSTEDRLRGIPPEDRLRGIPPEDRLRGLSEKELDRLRELLDRGPRR
jgi:hypothetical protein